MHPVRVATMALSALTAALMLTACSRPEPVPEAVRAVRTMTVQLEPLNAELDFAAEIQARVESRLAFRVGGKLLRRSVEVGQVVRNGQLLAQVDAEDLRLGEHAARAAEGAAEVNASQAGADLERFKELFAQGFISSAELQRRESTARVAQAQLAQARAQGRVQTNQAGYGQLLAPADGVITSVDAETGMVLAAGQPIIRLAHAGPRDVVFTVPEHIVANVRALLGREGGISVQLWGRAAAPLAATVREVAAAADPQTRTFRIKADVGAADLDLGQTASVTLTRPTAHGVVRLPLAALLQRQGRTLVWLLDPDKMTVRTQPVEVADAHGNDVVIASGLSAGMEVVTAGVHVLTDGQHVARYSPEPATAAR